MQSYNLKLQMRHASVGMDLCMDLFNTGSVMQVLAIVLGNSNSGTSTGLFFPEGVVGSNPVYTTVS